jgi:aerobic carbon-monoxide dehydrogenase large subunit
MSLVTGVPEDRLRVIAPEVGGGFGSKIPQTQGDFITAFCAMKLGRPVKWIETRSENYVSTTHGRDHVQDVELAATTEGVVTGLRARCGPAWEDTCPPPRLASRRSCTG